MRIDEARAEAKAAEVKAEGSRGPVLTLERPCQLLEHSLGQHLP